GEALDKVRDVVASLHGQRRELERGDPAFSAILQRGQLIRAEIQAHELVEVRRGFLRRETEKSHTDLNELAARAKASQRQRRIGAAGNHQVHVRRETIDEEGHRLVDLAVVYDV